jgi:hypothetical protein
MSIPKWFAGQIATADRMNARNMELIAQEGDLTLTTTTATASEIVFLPEPNAVYSYWLYISYSADTDTDMFWEWGSEASTGVLMASFTQAYATDAGTGVNTGSLIVMRRPGNTTNRVAGGSDVANFHSAYDSGTFSTNGAPTQQTLYVARNSAGSGGTTILRGGNQTRMIYQRIG